MYWLKKQISNKTLMQTATMATILGCFLLAFFIIYETFVFIHTLSYRIVIIFAILTLLSNITAKLFIIFLKNNDR